MKQKCSLVLGYLMSASLLYAQPVQLTGIVQDETGAPMVGVSVLVQQEGKGTVTDIDGAFQLSVSEGDKAMFSFTGYRTQEVVVNRDTFLKVRLQIDIINNQQDIYFGCILYSKIRQPTLSMPELSGEDFNTGHNYHAARLFQGLAPGVLAVRPGSGPMDPFVLRMRGLTSTNGAVTGRSDGSEMGTGTSSFVRNPSVEPLVVVDGLPGVPLEALDPEGIESITFLNDAAAQSRFGLQGGSGVILIATKKGLNNWPQVVYSSRLSLDRISRRFDVLDAAGFKRYAQTTGQNIEDFGEDTDWQEAITRDGWSQAHRLTLSGGNFQNQYYTSLQWRRVNSVLQKEGFDALNGQLSLQQNAFKDKLKISANLLLQNREENLSPRRALPFALNFNPTAPVRSDDPAYAGFGGYFQQLKFDYFNPVAAIEQQDHLRRIHWLHQSLQMRYQLSERLQWKAFYGYSQENGRSRQYTGRQSLWGEGLFFNGQAVQNQWLYRQHFVQTGPLYQFDFSDLSGNLGAGWQHRRWYREGFGGISRDFLTDFFGAHNLGAGQSFPNGNGVLNSFRKQTVITGANIFLDADWRDRLFLSGSWTREGSSRLGADNRWADFYHIGLAGHVIPQYMSSFELSARLNYGQAGILPFDDGLSHNLLALDGPFTLVNDIWQPAARWAQTANPALQPEIKRGWNAGLNMSMRNNQLELAVDYFSNQTKGVIETFQDPVHNNPQYRNMLGLQSRGWDFSLKAQPFPAHYHTTLVVSRVNNRMQDIGDLQTGSGDFLLLSDQTRRPIFRIAEGASIGQIQGARVLNIADGNFNYKDRNGDGFFTLFEDGEVVARAWPKWFFGWQHKLEFGPLSIKCLFRGAIGHDIFDTYRFHYEVPAYLTSYNLLRKVEQSGLSPSNFSVQVSDYFVQKASYLRLDNLEAGYNWVPRIKGMQTIYAFLAVENLFTITGYDGLDPEARISGAAKVITGGIDNQLAPIMYPTRTWTLGWRVTW